MVKTLTAQGKDQFDQTYREEEGFYGKLKTKDIKITRETTGSEIFIHRSTTSSSSVKLRVAEFERGVGSGGNENMMVGGKGGGKLDL